MFKYYLCHPGCCIFVPRFILTGLLQSLCDFQKAHICIARPISSAHGSFANSKSRHARRAQSKVGRWLCSHQLQQQETTCTGQQNNVKAYGCQQNASDHRQYLPPWRALASPSPYFSITFFNSCKKGSHLSTLCYFGSRHQFTGWSRRIGAYLVGTYIWW